MRHERGVFANSNIRQRELIAWFDAQEQKPLLRVASRTETVEPFDPLHRGRRADDFRIPERIVEVYAAGEPGEQGRQGGKKAHTQMELS